MAANGPGTFTAYVGLGANLGDARATLRQALDELQATPGVQSCAASRLYSSAPVDATGPDFVNAVARLETTLSPHALLQTLQAIEQGHGRERPWRNAPRTLDLDLLLHDQQPVNDAVLTVPHPRMHERAFVLRPLKELAPGLTLAQGTLDELLARCAGQKLNVLPEPGTTLQG